MSETKATSGVIKSEAFSVSGLPIQGDKLFLADRVKPSVIWITGFSGSGKTTVGRKFNSLLKDIGIKTVFLDGDDLRGIFGGKWGYSQEDRIELAHIYFRLCNTLSSQGVTVIISAIAMYEEIYKWVKDNIDSSMQIYLKVPEDERVNRDKFTKKVYSDNIFLNAAYDEPSSPDLVINNHGENSPQNSAELILEQYKLKIFGSVADKGRTLHWDGYYATSKQIFEASDFAVSCADQMKNQLNILEVGCGNGRDSVYFSSLGHNVTAIDPSDSAIGLCIEKHADRQIKFIATKLPDLVCGNDQFFDVVYSRFCLHAMTEKEEIETLAAASNLLKPNGLIMIECRSINDPLARKGEVISANERIFGHYRRFIVLDELRKNLLNAGFLIKDIFESNNLAILADENPVVIRVHAIKK